MPMDRNQAMGIAAVFLAIALVVLDAGITNIALPTISASLDVPPGQVILVTSAYQLALLMGLLPAAHVAARTGTRNLFVIGLCTFTFASVMAALAPAFPVLVAARFIQGLGGAAILSLGMPLLRTLVGRDRFGSAIGWNALNVALCAAAGPALGALLIAATGWPWLFLLNLPVGLAALAASLALPAGGRRSAAAVDGWSILLYAGSITLLFTALQNVIAAPVVAAFLAVAAAASFTFLFSREFPKSAPLLPFDLMGDRAFRLAVGASMFCFVAQCAGQLALPFYLLHNLGEDGLATGAVISCWPIAVALASRAAVQLAQRTSAAILCATGTLILSTGLAAIALLQPSPVGLALCTILCGIGFGLFQVPNNRNLFFTAPEHRSEAAGGMQGTARLAGQTVGAVLVSLVFSWAPGIAAPQFAFAMAAAFAVGSAMLSLRQLKRARQPAAPCAS